LILAGWTYSSSQEKHVRWNETVRWAEEFGLKDVIPPIRDSESYFVDELSSSNGWEIGDQFTKPTPRPAKEWIVETLLRLRADWVSVVGEEFAAVTSPIKFTGHKRCRLIVYADSKFPPSACSFREFRSSINRAIHPHVVHHIDFTHARYATNDHTQ
jgi:hypothetical protein